MTLWIRSQDKRNLVKIDYIYLSDDEILGYTATIDRTIKLGTYKTEQRAREILDDIQKLVNGDLILFANVEVSGDIGDYLKPSKAIMYNDKTDKPKIEYAHRDCVVYEMPQE